MGNRREPAPSRPDKEQRDEHIRRYAELLTERDADKKNQVQQNASPEIGYKKPPPQEKGVARRVAEETGVSVDTVRRALNPKPQPIKSVIEPESEAEAIIREANAIVSAWNRARQEAGFTWCRQPRAAASFSR